MLDYSLARLNYFSFAIFRFILFKCTISLYEACSDWSGACDLENGAQNADTKAFG